MGMNKKEQGAVNIRKLQEKIKRVRDGKETFIINPKNKLINRSKTAEELGFGRSVWAQNTECAKLLQDAEIEFCSTDSIIISPHNSSEDESSEVKLLRHRTLELEKKVASLMAENELVVSELEKQDMENQKIILDGKTFDI